LIVTVSGGPDRSWSGGVRPVCAVSADGRQLAFRDLEGVVHLWDLEESKEVTSRLLRDASQLFFTAHGIAAVRGRSVQMFGGKEGDFSVTLPGRESSPATPVAISANMVSPDGHRLVIARLTASQADVVDLRTRSVVASVSFAAGTPQFAFPPSGDRLLVAGLRNGSALQGWEIPSPPPVRTYLGAPLQVFRGSRDSRRLLVFLVDPVEPRFELRDENGAILLAGKVGSPGLAVALSDDGQRLAVSDDRGAVVLDAASGRSLGRVDCEGCHRLALSADGSRLLMASEKGIELWDVGSGRTLWKETERLGRLDGPLGLSGNGQAVLWGEDRILRVHREGQASDGELKLDQRIQSAAFSYDNTRLVAVTSGTIGVWGVGRLESRWQVRNPSWAPQWVQWSGDDSAVMVSYDGQGVALRDSGTGRRFATIGVDRPDALATQEMVLPDLRHRLSRGNGAWEVSLLPPPDDLPPRESLARALAEAGLQMQGVELVDAPPRSGSGLEAERL
jgi:WD40 repeat protein